MHGPINLRLNEIFARIVIKWLYHYPQTNYTHALSKKKQLYDISKGESESVSN
jgi:hypothetical protein